MSKIKCPECGALNPEDARICQVCGTSLIDQIENCLDIANPDTTCEEPGKHSKKVLLYSIVMLIIILAVLILILSFAPTAYWG